MAPMVLLLVTLAADGPAQSAAAVAPGARPAAVSAPPRAAAPAAAASDRRDVVLLLDGGPLHLRLNLALGGVSLAEARRQYVQRLIVALDVNKDGKVARDEAQKSPLFRTKSRPSANAFLESLKTQSAITPRDIAQKVEDKIGQLVGYREDLNSSKNDLEVF